MSDKPDQPRDTPPPAKNPFDDLAGRVKALESDKQTLVATLRGVKIAAILVLPVVAALLFLQGVDVKNSLKQYKEFSDKLPSLLALASEIEPQLASLEKRSAIVENRLLLELEKAERLVGNKHGIFLGPFNDYDEATLYASARKLDDKEFWIIRSFSRKGQYLIVFAKSLSATESEARRFLDDLPNAALDSTEQRIEPLTWPIKIETRGRKRIVTVDQKTTRTIPFLNIPMDVNISRVLPPLLEAVESMEDLAQLLRSKDFDPKRCNAVTLRYLDLPKNLIIAQGSTENLATFYSDK